MSGLIALLDDVAAIAKVAAASLDDVASQAARAGAKAAGAAIDDAAVSPKYVHGFAAKRELPIVWKIARGSIFNKLVILLPAALLLSAFAPWLITPLLMLGGSYLCFEGAEKVWHLFAHDAKAGPKLVVDSEGHAGLEERRVKGAIKTDFILSAEIMTIALSSIPADDAVWVKGVILAIVAVGITILVYGFVALIVKTDDFGLHLAERGNGPLARFGCWIVKVMPTLMNVLTVVGTAAMIWVGGNIVIHGLHGLGIHAPIEFVEHSAARAVQAVPPGMAGTVSWTVTALIDGIFGLIYGLLLLPVVIRVINPVIDRLRGAPEAG